MIVYAFDWKSVDDHGRALVICFAKKVSHETVVLRIRGYRPSCYVRSIHGDVVRPTSNDITLQRTYDRISFPSFADLHAYTRHHRTYMSHEDDICHFLSTHSLPYVGWIETPSTDCMVSEVVSVAESTIPPPRFLIASFDIEVYSRSRTMPKSYRRDDRIFMISVVSSQGDRIVIHDEDEMRCIDRLCETIRDLDPDIVTGFNILNFDFRYILDRLHLRLRTSPSIDLSRYPPIPTKFETIAWTNASYGSQDFVKPDIPGRIVVDVFPYFKRMNLDRHSLNYISEQFLGESKHDMPIDTMMTLYEHGHLDRIAQYCTQDALLVLQLIDRFHIIVELFEQARTLKCRVDDILTRGEQYKINHNLVFECVRRNVILESTGYPPWEGSYEGAMVYDPVPGRYPHCVTLDYQSLYPSVIIRNNICPSTYVGSGASPSDTFHSIEVAHGRYHYFRKQPIGILPGMLRTLLDARTRVKGMMRDCQDAETRTILDKRQNAYKIAANSIYGITGTKFSKYLRHRPCAESVSAGGRYYFNLLIEFIRPRWNIIYGDTDSCIVSLPETMDRDECVRIGHEICDRFNHQLDDPVHLKFEQYAQSMIIFSKKKYIMYDNNVITYKGVTNARRGYCSLVKMIYESIVKMIFENTPPEIIASWVHYRIQRILSGSEPMDRFVISKSVKSIHEYATDVPQKIMAMRLIDEEGEIIVPGSRLEYVFVDNGETKQGLKMYRPEEVDRKHLRIDYRYYIEKQIAPTIDQLLSMIGYPDLVRSILRSS